MIERHVRKIVLLEWFYKVTAMKTETSVIKKYFAQIYTFVAFFVILTLGVIIRWPLVNYSLPIAAHVDERNSFRVLYRFNQGNLNPGFFDYPTFYYYLTFFVTKPFIRDFQDIVFSGRIVNLIIGGFLIVIVFLYAKFVFGSDLVGLIAMIFVATSPTLILSGSYIITDVLLALLILSTLLLLEFFFKTANYKYWFMGIIVIGLALSTKYTATMIIITYLIYEFFVNPAHNVSLDNKNLLVKRFSPKWLSAIMLLGAILCLGLYFFFPSYDWFENLLRQQGTLNSELDARDINLIESFRLKFLGLSIILAIVFGLTLRFKFFARFCILRPYWAILLISVVFLLASPFLVLSWQTAIYNISTAASANVVGGTVQGQWWNFIDLYLHTESIIILCFLPIGIFWLVKHKKPVGLLVIYLIVCYVSYASGRRVFPRYWAAILPAVFIVSAYGVYATANLLKKAQWVYVAFLLLLVAGIGMEIQPKYATHVGSKRQEPNSAYGAYHWILDYQPDKVYYSSRNYVPYFELRVKGFEMQEIPDAWLRTSSSRLLSQMDTGDILIVDNTGKENLAALLGQTLILRWGSETDHGQYIYQKEGE